MRFMDPDGMWPNEKGGDYSGFIQNATLQMYNEHPILAFFKDVSAEILNNLTPVGAIDDAIITYNTPNASIGDKIKATVNVAISSIIIKGEGKGPISEKTLKEIGPAGDAGGTVMKQLPEKMQTNMRTTKGGTIFKDPDNPSGNNVRVQGGNPNSPNPAQRNSYVKEVKNGKMIDSNGDPVDPKSVDAHISKEKYKYEK